MNYKILKLPIIITVLIVTILFIVTSVSLAILSDNALRVPIINIDKESIVLDGPFVIPDESNTLIRVSFLTSEDAINEAIDSWFKFNTSPYFKRLKWETVASLAGYWKRGKVIKLESKSGEILGLAYYDEVKDFWFHPDCKIENPVHYDSVAYELVLIEISYQYRGKGLGQFIIAQIAKYCLENPNVKEIILIIYPIQAASEYYKKKIGASSLYINLENPDDISDYKKYFVVTIEIAKDLILTVQKKFCGLSKKYINRERYCDSDM